MICKKKTFTATKDGDIFIQHGSVDVAELKAMLQTDPFFCRPENQKGNAKLGGRQSNMNRFKPGVDSVILIFSDFSGMFVYKFPYFYKYQEMLMPVLLSVLRDHFGLSDPVQHIMRLQFACMNPKSKILKHTDHGGWVKNGHRIHIPVVVPKTNDGRTSKHFETATNPFFQLIILCLLAI